MPNRLAQETSPYLQQHADNPVDWYPWGEEALARARQEDKPILLSIGYSACHWCHVMAHESFEDDAIAARMNALFVNIKVDREERPDLDQIYQSAHYLLTRRSGGWPLTVFLTPDGTPYAAGTYFPKTPRHGMPGFGDLLDRIESIYRSRRSEIEQQSTALLGALAAHVPQSDGEVVVADAPLVEAVRQLSRNFDPQHGGFGQAPKFPHPYELDFLLRRHAAGESGCLDMVKLTLVQMAEGGLFDQIGGGFCRYSTDEHWTIPHFEKMLYDNGPLLALYADAYLATSEPLFQRVASETAQWVLREMQAPAGGYYSSLDADSEHEEGKFYVWTPDEVRALLSPEEYSVVEPHYGLDRTPNFEQRYWHLRVAKPLTYIAHRTGLTPEQCAALLATARDKLLAAREKRVRPGRDDKVLTSWNALMIRGMAKAARALDRPDWLDSAQRALEFLRTTLWRDGRLLATHKDGKSHLNAYLDDYAFLLDALLELLQAGFRPPDLDFACAIADALLAHFEDREAGGFFFTSHDHERLIQRPKPGLDNATPAGNAVAAFALQRLGCLLGEARYLGAAERTLKLFWPQIESHPSAFASMLNALAEHLEPPRTVVLRGPAAALEPWRKQLRSVYRPTALVLSIANGAKDLSAALAHPDSAAVNAWVCEGVKCLPAIADLVELQQMLGGPGPGKMPPGP